MNKFSVLLSPWIILFLSWAVPLYSLIYNRIYPSYGSALGVAYGFIIGCVIHSFLLIAWLLIRQSKIQTFELIILVISLIILILLTFASNSGSLSQFSLLGFNDAFS